MGTFQWSVQPVLPQPKIMVLRMATIHDRLKRSWRQGLCILVAASAGCISSLPERSPTVSAPTVSELCLESLLFDNVNEYRRRHNLLPLLYDTVLAGLARGHSRRMAEQRGEGSHEGFEERLRELRRHRRASATAENVAMNAGYADPADRAFRDLLASPAHHATIVGQFTHTGVGVARAADSSYYFTQLFAAYRP